MSNVLTELRANAQWGKLYRNPHKLNSVEDKLPALSSRLLISTGTRLKNSARVEAILFQETL